MLQRESLISHATSSTLRLRSIWLCVCVLVFLLVLVDGSTTDSEKLLVNTQWGPCQGKWTWTRFNRSVANFLGIPYAQPPVGNLRFRSPQKWNSTWTTTRDATDDGEKCIQIDYMRNEVTGSEDCLFLNIFVPCSDSDAQRPTNLPVLVFVHGGGYTIGSSDSKQYAPDYLLDQNIILVTMNYRLSALGFFSTTTSDAPGNYAIKDVKMALEWVQENIQSFGGNPDSVTLMGHSAGSAATHILALSTKTEGLFHRYVLLSGSATSTWNFHSPRSYRQSCLKLAKLVGCLPEKDDDVNATNETTTNNSTNNPETGDDISNQDFKVRDDEEMMNCMRTVDAKILEATTTNFTVWRQHPWCTFGPTLEAESEDAVLTMHPLKILKNGLFCDRPMMMQIVKDEGLTKTFELFIPDNYPDLMNQLIENDEEYLPEYMEYNEVVSNRSNFVSAVRDYYFNAGNMSWPRNITKMMSDCVIIWPMYQALQYQSGRGNSSIFFSYCAFQPTLSYAYTNYMGFPIYYGTAHGDDVNWLFPILNYIYNKYTTYNLSNTENDNKMINIMTEMYANFVINGIPTSQLTPAWPNYCDNHEYMRFGNGRSPDIEVRADFPTDRMEFWEKLMMNQSVISMDDVFVSEPTSID